MHGEADEHYEAWKSDKLLQATEKTEGAMMMILSILSGSRFCTISRAEIHQSSRVCNQPERCNISHPTPAERARKQREDHLKTLERKLSNKKQRAVMNGQTLLRHEVVLQFLRIRLSRREGETRESLPKIVARYFNRGGYFAQRIIRWEIEWTLTGAISGSRRGCIICTRLHTHTESAPR